MTADPLRALLDLVNERQRVECERLIRDARSQARDMVSGARREARGRMHATILGERARGGREISAAEAHLKTRRRQHEQRHAVTLLGRGWGLLEAALEARWRDRFARVAWVEGLVIEAMQALPQGPRRIMHPVDWPSAEREALRDRLRPVLAEPLEFVEDAGIRAGLRLCADGTCVDGTIDGLVAGRTAVEAELLALLEAGPRVEPR